MFRAPPRGIADQYPPIATRTPADPIAEYTKNLMRGGRRMSGAESSPQTKRMPQCTIATRNPRKRNLTTGLSTRQPRTKPRSGGCHTVSWTVSAGSRTEPDIVLQPSMPAPSSSSSSSSPSDSATTVSAAPSTTTSPTTTMEVRHTMVRICQAPLGGARPSPPAYRISGNSGAMSHPSSVP